MTALCRRFARPTTLVLSIALALATCWLAAPAAHAAAPPKGSQYVALGDSYAAGYGISPPTGQPVAGCAQSAKDYPHQVAAKLGLKLTDVSCSGATTANIDQTPQQTPAGTAPLQDKALSASTKLVTVTIGGNDLGFADIAQYCLAQTVNGPLAFEPTEQNCKSHFDPPGGPDTLQEKIQSTVVPNVERVLADIKSKAPNAQVYFVDYPAISTTEAQSPDPSTYPASCFSPLPGPQSFPFTSVDIPYFESVESGLDAALSTQVGKSGDNFVQSYPQSLSHSACHGTSDPWMNGIGINGTGLTAGSLHPNLEGATHLADEALAAIGPAVTPTSPSAPTTSASASPSGTSAASATTEPLAATGSGDTGSLTLVGVLLVLVGGLALRAGIHRRTVGRHR